MQDLQEKTAVWSTIFYGPLEYLLCYAAAGQHLQLTAIERGAHTRPVAISRSFDMTKPAGRAQIVLAAFNLYKLLSAVNSLLPAYVLPVGKDLTRNTGVGQHIFKRTLHFRADSATVQKRIQPWNSFRQAFGMQIGWLRRAYSKTAQSAGLVHKQPGSAALSVGGDVYTVELTPVGLRNGDARPQTEDEARLACHGLLHGLDALHKVCSSYINFASNVFLGCCMDLASMVMVPPVSSPCSSLEKSQVLNTYLFSSHLFQESIPGVLSLGTNC